MAYFPMFTDVSQKKCMIVGGGKVALRKAETLLRYGADVYVVAEEICGELKCCLPKNRQRIGHFLEKEMEGCAMVIAATNNREINHAIAVSCHKKRIPVNVIDAPEECSFIFPAVVLKGDISIGINSGAKGPALTKQIRKNIEQQLPEYYVEIASQLGNLREYVKAEYKEEKIRRRILKNVTAEAFVKERRLTKEEIDRIIGEAAF